MNTDFSDFRKTADECGEAAACLAQYSLNLKRVINKEKTTIHWCTERIKKIVGPIMKDYSTYNSYDERMGWAIETSEIAKRLRYIKAEAELRLMRIDDLYFCVKNISDKFGELQKSLKGIR